MNLMTLILTIAMLFGFSDFLTERSPRLQRDIYYIALVVIAFLFTIKYYYGPDIRFYVPFYDAIGSPRYLFSHLNTIPQSFEPGFALFCSILKSAGLSFYWMTAVISIFYFAVIAMLFKRLDRKRAFALALLVVLDYKCIFATYRQCLAVACFVLMILCLQDRKYLLSVLLAVLTISFHKSGLLVVAAVYFFYMVRGKWVKPYVYQLILILLLIMCVLPMTGLMGALVSHLHMPSLWMASLKHHLGLGRHVQVVFLVYAATLVVFTHFTQYRHTRAEAIAATALVGLIVVATLYQYYYLLWRLRSYFLPIVIVYGFHLVQKTEDEQVRVPYGALVKQAASVLIALYMVHSVYAFNRDVKTLHHPVYRSCTVFDLIHHRSSDVKKSQMKLASDYWRDDFMKNESNKVK